MKRKSVTVIAMTIMTKERRKPIPGLRNNSREYAVDVERLGTRKQIVRRYETTAQEDTTREDTKVAVALEDVVTVAEVMAVEAEVEDLEVDSS